MYKIYLRVRFPSTPPTFNYGVHYENEKANEEKKDAEQRERIEIV